MVGNGYGELRMIRSQGLVTLSLGASDRKDAWWIGPLVSGVLFLCFCVYATWAAWQNDYYQFGPYLSPFYSPLFKPDWLPLWLSPAFLILGAPLGFRLTCYYYRKFLYRAFLLDPPACAVGEGKSGGYSGERTFPFIIMNLHRFFLYLAILVWSVLLYDTVLAFNWNGQIGMGLGTLVMIVNVVLLGLYTFSCHSFRHLIGGKHDCFSCMAGGKVRHDVWRGVSWLNGRHQLWAWLSMFSVGLTDVYIRLCAMHILEDQRLF
jgi:hypothetical protein